jgi:spore maturation protein CgeB
LNGTLLSDNIKQIKDVLPEADVFLSDDSNVLVEKAIQLCNLDSEELEQIKASNIEYIKLNHTYCNRVKTLLSL